MNTPQLPILSCTGCGVCCHLQRRPPYLPTELDVLDVALAAELAADETEDGPGPCMWLMSDRRCKHYDQRPEICRQFELGGEECRTVRVQFTELLPKAKVFPQ